MSGRGMESAGKCVATCALAWFVGCAGARRPASPSAGSAPGSATPVVAPSEARAEQDGAPETLSTSGGAPASAPAPAPADAASAKSKPIAGPKSAGAKAPSPPAKVQSSADKAEAMVVLPAQLAAAQAAVDDASKAFGASGTDCASLCKALGSMSNATEHLCGLVVATADEPRCTDARARVAAAQAKVKATCSSTCG